MRSTIFLDNFSLYIIKNYPFLFLICDNDYWLLGNRMIDTRILIILTFITFAYSTA
jgi:hypothetical protein